MVVQLQSSLTENRNNGFAGRLLLPGNYSTKPVWDHLLRMSRSLEPTIPMQRILILGSSGSGKSTLARQLGERLDLPVIHLDRHYWHPGWIGTPFTQWETTVMELIRGNAWIMDGNYRRTLNIRLAAADTVIFLDMPPWLCMWRAIKRRIEYSSQPRPDIAPGCRERILDPQLPLFLQWIWNYPQRARPDIKRRLSQLDADRRIIRLRSPQEANSFLANPYSAQFRWPVNCPSPQAAPHRSTLEHTCEAP